MVNYTWLNDPSVYSVFPSTLSDNDVHTYQLRAYIYQARDMYGSDHSDLSGELGNSYMYVDPLEVLYP